MCGVLDMYFGFSLYHQLYAARSLTFIIARLIKLSTLFPQKRLNERVLIDPTKTEEEETLPSLRSQNASSDEVNSE